MNCVNNNLISLVLGLVKQVEKKTGPNKKEIFYTLLKAVIGEDEFLKNIDIINHILETIIYISKCHVISGINKTTCLPAIVKCGFLSSAY